MTNGKQTVTVGQPVHLPAPCRNGFTLIELLVVIFIIGVLISLLLPAVQMAREAARRVRCTNNLKELTLALHNYTDVNGVLPMGYANQWCEWIPDAMCLSFGPFVALLPQLEQQPLFNAMNFERNLYNSPNTTIFATSIGTLWCPSDPTIDSPVTHDLAETVSNQIYLTNYGACTGTWFNYGRNPERTAQNNGLFWGASSVGFAQVTDGLSCTIALGERAHGLLTESSASCWSWWADGDIGDTLFSALYPINPHKVIKDGSLPFTDSLYWASSASSLHPGGANFAMLDGSVRFLKESINCWSIDPATNLPPGLTQGGNPVLYSWNPTVLRWGVFQKLATRKFDDLVSAGDY
jgi:prepilin-type N-terminal cleavage/methylation domain-containing protein/prepilin-type processing-associated H-X9-DG protein